LIGGGRRRSQMLPPPFDYVAPRSLDEVLDLLAEHGDEARSWPGARA